MESSSNETKNTNAFVDAPPAISNARILTCSIGLTILSALMLPVQVGKMYKAQISITATGVRDENNKGAEVWVSETSGPGIVALTNAAGWERRENVQVSYKTQPATLSWEGEIAPEYQLHFVRHAYSGQMILNINGTSREYSLYSAKDQAPLIVRPFDFMTNPQPSYKNSLLKAILTLIGLLILIHLTLLVIIRRTDTKPNASPPPPMSIGGLALPSLIIYTIVLLAMWPAQMSPDSVTHWAESESGRFTDSHPALLTLALWLVTRFWHSPTVIPAIQILALTGVTALILSRLQNYGVPRIFCRIIAITFPLYPANFLMVTTIWKDVPYTIALMFAFWLMLSLTQTRGKSVNSHRWRFYFLAAMFLVMFTRHNGVIVALAFPLICAICYRNVAPRFFLKSSLGLFAIFLFVKSVLFPLLNVAPIQKIYTPAIAMHVLGAHIHDNTHFTNDEEALLKSVYALDRWKALYTCQTHGFLFQGDALGTPSYDELATHSFELNILAIRKSWENPGVYFKHQTCVTSMLWRISPFRGEGIYISPVGITDVPLAKDFKLVSDSQLPRVRALLEAALDWSKRQSRIWFYWRPGLWLLLSIIVGVGFSIAARDSRLLLLLAPTLLNTISLLPLILAPDFRFQWVAPAIGIFLIPLALFRQRIWHFSPEGSPHS